MEKVARELALDRITEMVREKSGAKNAEVIREQIADIRQLPGGRKQLFVEEANFEVAMGLTEAGLDPQFSGAALRSPEELPFGGSGRLVMLSIGSIPKRD